MARECQRHDGDALDLEDCAECIAWMEGEERYWSAYFGKAQIQQAADDRRWERETYGRELSDSERMEEARRLK